MEVAGSEPCPPGSVWERLVAPEGRPSVARGVNPWRQAAQRSQALEGRQRCDSDPTLPPLRGSPAEIVRVQGLAPLASDGRPSGAALPGTHAPATAGRLGGATFRALPRLVPLGLSGRGRTAGPLIRHEEHTNPKRERGFASLTLRVRIRLLLARLNCRSSRCGPEH